MFDCITRVSLVNIHVTTFIYPYFPQDELKALYITIKKCLFGIAVRRFLFPGGREGERRFYQQAWGYFNEVGGNSKQTIVLFWPEMMHFLIPYFWKTPA